MDLSRIILLLQGKVTTLVDKNGEMQLVPKNEVAQLEKQGFKKVDDYVDSMVKNNYQRPAPQSIGRPMLEVGTVKNGYKFLGGDPKDKNYLGEDLMEDKKPWEEDWSASAPQAESEKAPWEEDWGGEEILPEEQTSKIEAIAGGISEGGLGGFSSELMGGAKALAAKLGLADSETKSIFDKDVNLKEEYQAQRDKHQKYLDLLKKEHPAISTGSEIAGAIGTGAIGKIPLIPRAVAEGAAFGLGTSEADLTKGEFKEAAKDTAKGAAIGGITAGALHGVGKGYNKTYKAKNGS